MYGENTRQLRAELTTLLRQHRIQQRLGGKGLHNVPVTTTAEQREQLGQQITRYRHGVLVWCLQATRAANTHISYEGASGRTEGPAGDLRYRLTAAIDAPNVDMPTVEELSTPQSFSMVESWRMAARAAALGEHDFGSEGGAGHLSPSQRMTVLKDAAEIARGLVSLDRRYEGIPGWTKLEGHGRLGRAAEACATFAGQGRQDYSVDLRGWSPRALVDQGQPQPGIAGILQGEYNLLVQLQRFPEALSLRLILDSQRIVSHEIASKVRSTDPTFADRCEARAETFRALIQVTRNVSGLLGNGGPAAAQAAIVAARSQRLSRSEETDERSLRQLGQLLDRIDTRLTDVIEHGARHRLYFLREKLPHLADHAQGLVHAPAGRYSPIDSSMQTSLIKIVRTRLRPSPEIPQSPQDAARSRLEFQEAITHRPTPRGLPLGGPSL
jgi:hypothetical protein